MLEPLAVFKWMLTSETPARTLRNAQGITQAEVTLASEDVTSGSGSAASGQKKSKKKLDARTAAMAFTQDGFGDCKLWAWDLQVFSLSSGRCLERSLSCGIHHMLRCAGMRRQLAGMC